MKIRLVTALAATTLVASPAMAHVVPESMIQHFAEHLLIAVAIGIPLIYGFLRLLKRSGDSRR